MNIESIKVIFVFAEDGYLPFHILGFFLPGFDTRSDVHWNSFNDDSDGDLDAFLSDCKELFLEIIGVAGVVGKPSLLPAAIFYLFTKETFPNHMTRMVSLSLSAGENWRVRHCHPIDPICLIVRLVLLSLFIISGGVKRVVISFCFI